MADVGNVRTRLGALLVSAAPGLRGPAADTGAHSAETHGYVPAFAAATHVAAPPTPRADIERSPVVFVLPTGETAFNAEKNWGFPHGWVSIEVRAVSRSAACDHGCFPASSWVSPSPRLPASSGVSPSPRLPVSPSPRLPASSRSGFFCSFFGVRATRC